MSNRLGALGKVRHIVRIFVKKAALVVDTTSGGKISPNFVTLTALFGHIFIGLVIADGQLVLAGALLIFFGLFDALDGELARLQNKQSNKGMLLDSITDRVKEIIIYVAIGYYLISQGYSYALVWVIAACGISLLISYMNAWAEVVTAKNSQNKNPLNKVYRGGLMSFEIRMTVIILGLFANNLLLAAIVITVLGSMTVLTRLTKALNNLD